MLRLYMTIKSSTEINDVISCSTVDEWLLEAICWTRDRYNDTHSHSSVTLRCSCVSCMPESPQHPHVIYSCTFAVLCIWPQATCTLYSLQNFADFSISWHGGVLNRVHVPYGFHELQPACFLDMENILHVNHAEFRVVTTVIISGNICRR